MKILLYLLAAVAALIVAAILTLWLMGFRKNAGGLSASIEIDRPPEAVWPWLTEPDRLKQWVTWLVEVSELTPEVRGVGRRFAWVMNDPNMKQRIEIVGECIGEEPGKSLSVRLTSVIGFDGTSTWRLVDLGGRTRFESEASYRYHRWLYRLLEPLITPQAKKKLLADIAKLERLAESS